MLIKRVGIKQSSWYRSGCGGGGKTSGTVGRVLWGIIWPMGDEEQRSGRAKDRTVHRANRGGGARRQTKESNQARVRNSKMQKNPIKKVRKGREKTAEQSVSWPVPASQHVGWGEDSSLAIVRKWQRWILSQNNVFLFKTAPWCSSLFFLGPSLEENTSRSKLPLVALQCS